jgi:Homing endonuclease associated repeat
MRRGTSRIEIISDIRSVARRLNHSPSSVEYKQLGSFDVRTVQRKFKTSWSQIIDAAGLRYSRRTFGRIAPTEELKRDLLRVARELDHPPTRTEYQTHGQFDPETMRRRSGKREWADAVATLTGLDRERIKQQQARGGCYRTTEEWLSRLLALSRDLGHAPTTRESNEAGINAHQLCLRVGGKWVDVLKAAKIDLRTRPQHAILLSTSTETLLADVIDVAQRLGRPPKVREYTKTGHCSFLAVRGRLGGWGQVKKLVAEKLSGSNIGQSTFDSAHPAPNCTAPSGDVIRTFFKQANLPRLQTVTDARDNA